MTSTKKGPGGAKSWGPSHEAPQPGAPPPGCHVARRNSRTAVQWPNPRQPQLRRNATSFEKLGLDARGCETTLRCPGRHAGISPETRTLVIGPSDDATSLVYVPFAQGTMVQALNGLFGRRSAPAISSYIRSSLLDAHSQSLRLARAPASKLPRLEGGRHTCRNVRTQPWQHFCQYAGTGTIQSPH